MVPVLTGTGRIGSGRRDTQPGGGRPKWTAGGAVGERERGAAKKPPRMAVVGRSEMREELEG